MVTPNDEHPPKYLVSLDPSAGANLTDEQFATELQEAIDAAVASAPEADRSAMIEALQRANVIPAGSDDEAMAKLLARVASLRVNRARQLVTAAQANVAARPPARVRLAVSESPTPDSARATVIRQPEDSGVPVVLLSRHATERDADLAVRTALLSLKKDGSSVQRRIMIKVHVSGTALPSAAPYRAILSQLQTHGVETLPGVGRVRYTDILVPTT